MLSCFPYPPLACAEPVLPKPPREAVLWVEDEDPDDEDEYDEPWLPLLLLLLLWRERQRSYSAWASGEAVAPGATHVRSRWAAELAHIMMPPTSTSVTTVDRLARYDGAGSGGTSSGSGLRWPNSGGFFSVSDMGSASRRLMVSKVSYLQIKCAPVSQETSLHTRLNARLHQRDLLPDLGRQVGRQRRQIAHGIDHDGI
jgi:hypothetical protein